ncbi:hypothetical protein COT99_04095 [Candidatus Falkowbacteria bacterium CG10_big_fil_rev_8_21_14_0_10_43_10]|uniref:DUF4257 domain-containing protein n=1 Tax=Candidatus Falkowbacteria bacterium CG10_big_fil_rev_8_21_14_0_10_43_10 TaxID=1974567 RepID=A0A2H0V194_9BACT|nr:MAG: hypothetical protein COT99_04095 [Candidatus Falkowbacteria bacterium CG10_big_fil_rev_8_21_14_0_10_43_10]
MNYPILIAGFAGGMVRGLVGFIKHQYSYKNVSFDLYYFLGMMFLSGVVGLLVAAAFDGNAVFAFIVGYAGGDFVENVYKIIAKKPSLYKIPNLK